MFAFFFSYEWPFTVNYECMARILESDFLIEVCFLFD